MTVCSEDFHCEEDFDAVLASFVLIATVQTLLRQLISMLQIKKMLLVRYSLHSHIISITVEKFVY